MDSRHDDTYCGIFALVGHPNVGKSTLVNALAGKKIAIVSAKPQTTRHRIQAVLTDKNRQMILIDTPGSHQKKSDLSQFIRQQVTDGHADVDGTIAVAALGNSVTQHPKSFVDREQAMWNTLHINPSAEKTIVVLNKTDRLRHKHDMLAIIDAWKTSGFDCVVPTCAKTASGVQRVHQELLRLLPKGPHLFPADMSTDQTDSFFAAELIREQAFRRLHQELPYAIAVNTDSFDSDADTSTIRISASIFVQREGEKAIVIGQGGNQIKKIGTAARKQLEQVFKMRVHLQLRVGIAKQWSRTSAGLARFGYK